QGGDIKNCQNNTYKCLACKQPLDSHLRYPIYLEACNHYNCLQCYNSNKYCAICNEPKIDKRRNFVLEEYDVEGERVETRRIDKNGDEIIIGCENATCPVCLDLFSLKTLPILFKCGHSICRQDSEQLNTCPICRAVLKNG